MFLIMTAISTVIASDNLNLQYKSKINLYDYFVAHSQSIISFKSVKESNNVCYVHKNSFIFYDFAMYKSKTLIKTKMLTNSNIYFTPSKHSTIDITQYQDISLKIDNSPLLKIKCCGSDLKIEVLNEKSIILTNKPSMVNSNAFEIIPEKPCVPCTIECILLSQDPIQCYDPLTDKEYIIKCNDKFTCFLEKENLFWLFTKNQIYHLKNFTQFQSDKKCSLIRYISNVNFLPGTYVTTCFSNIIRLPSLSDKVYTIPSRMYDELSIVTNNKVHGIGPWKLNINTISQFHNQIRSYNPTKKIIKFLNVLNKIIESLSDQLLSIKSTESNIKSIKQLQKYLTNLKNWDIPYIIENVEGKQCTDNLLSEVIDVLEGIKSTLMKNEYQFIDKSYETSMIQATIKFNSIIENIQTRLLPVVQMATTKLSNLEKLYDEFYDTDDYDEKEDDEEEDEEEEEGEEIKEKDSDKTKEEKSSIESEVKDKLYQKEVDKQKKIYLKVMLKNRLLWKYIFIMISLFLIILVIIISFVKSKHFNINKLF